MSKEDNTLFREAVKGITPLVHTKTEAITRIPVKKKQVITEKPNFAFFSDYENRDAVGSDDLIEFNRPGIQHKTLRKLRLGQYNVDAILDLHGMTVAEASDALQHFLAQCQNRKVRYALIIHGKGKSNNKPILKNKLNNWLPQTEQVLAFCSAMKHGKGGAVIVLLKN